MDVDVTEARSGLGLPMDVPVLGVLPGSRRSELRELTPPFLETAVECCRRKPDLQVLVPLVDQHAADFFTVIKKKVVPDARIRTVIGGSRQVLAASDVVLTASGTATLETLLSKKPMVVGYRMNALTWALAHHLRLVRSPWAAMANILVGDGVAPEFLQGECTAQNLVPAVMDWFDHPSRVEAVVQRYRNVHRELLSASSETAIDSLSRLIENAK
jgi:lipid-A-disaccharide synthase